MAENGWSSNVVEGPGGDATVPGIGIEIKVTIRKNSTVKAWFTSNGDEIQGVTGEPLVYEFTNTFDIDNPHPGFWFRYSHLNGMPLTDIKYATIRHDRKSSLAFAGFEDGIMSPLGQWLQSNRYVYSNQGIVSVPNALTIPSFDAVDGDIYVAVALDQLSSKEHLFWQELLGSRYEVANGRVISANDSECGDKSLFEGYYFGAAPIEFEPKLGWSSKDPFEGVVTMDSTASVLSLESTK